MKAAAIKINTKYHKSRAVANTVSQKKSAPKNLQGKSGSMPFSSLGNTSFTPQLKSNNILQNKKKTTSNSVIQRITVSVDETSHNVTGQNGNTNETQNKMTTNFNGFNFKKKYEDTVSENGFGKFGCAEPHALSQVVETANSKQNLKTKLQNAKFSRAEVADPPRGATILRNDVGSDHNLKHKYRDNIDSGRTPDYYKLTDNSNEVYVDPCGTCKSWLTYSSTGTFTIRDNLKQI